MVEEGRRLVDVGAHDGGTGRRRAQDGDREAAPAEGRIRHSGHGSQHASLPLGKTMRAAGIRPSMGSISSPWDDAAMESPMGLIKAECVHARTFETRDQAALEIFECIECSCNRVWTHSALGYLSPEEFERANWPEEDRHPMAA